MAKKLLNLEERLELPKGLIYRTIEDSVIILAPEKPNWIVTNQFGQEIIRRSQEGMTPKEIIYSLANKFDISLKDSFTQVANLLRQILEYKFFEATQPIDLDSTAPPTRLQLYVTNACNLRCTTCYMNSAKPLEGELSNEEWKGVIDSFNSIVGPTLVAFSGGEPLKREGFLDIARHARDRGNETFLFTNGTLIDDTNIEGIIKYIDKVQVSLDGTTAEANDSVRGKGTYERAVRGLKLLGGADMDVTISYCIVPENISDVNENLINFIESLGIKNIGVGLSVARKVGRWKSNCDNGRCQDVPLGESYNLLRETLLKLHKRGWDGPSYNRNIIKRNCTFGQRLVVDPVGNVFPCAETVFKIGNVREDNMGGLYEKLGEANKNSSVDATEICKPCNLRYICKGGCKTLRIQNHSDLFSQECGEDRKCLIYKKLLDGSIR